jgi:uncharacterized membrane protein YraQ (UPF0718 family)
MLLDLLERGPQVLWEPLARSLPLLATSFFSMLIGAMPFIVVAAFASAVLEVFVSRDAIARLVPRRGILGVLVAPLLGLFIPMCECGIVPVSRRMIQKGVPASAAISLMLANPVLNPLSVYATYLAFPFARQMVWLRMGMTYLVAVLIGLWMEFSGWQGDLVLHRLPGGTDSCAEGCGCDHHEHDHEHDHGGHHHGRTAGQKLQAVLEHAAGEFFDVLKYFIIGAGLAAISQALIDRALLEAIGRGPVLSVLVMIAFSYVLCVCSEADAFVAASFASTFSPGALLAFLVSGPMTDIKNTLMMLSAFNRRFVIALNILIVGLTAALAVGLNLIHL